MWGWRTMACRVRRRSMRPRGAAPRRRWRTGATGGGRRAACACAQAYSAAVICSKSARCRRSRAVKPVPASCTGGSGAAGAAGGALASVPACTTARASARRREGDTSVALTGAEASAAWPGARQKASKAASKTACCSRWSSITAASAACTSSRRSRPTASTAARAVSTRSGPACRPAACRRREKRVMWAASRMRGTSARGGVSTQFGQQARDFAAFDAGDVVLVLEQHAQAVVYGRRLQMACIQRHQGTRPVQGLGHARHLEEVQLAQALDEGHHLPRQALAGLGRLQRHDLQLALGVGKLHPVVEAAALERVVDFACAVAGDQRDGRRAGLDGAQLGHGDLVLSQHLEQEGIEGLVGAVELVDQQHRPPALAQRLQQRPLDQHLAGVEAAHETVVVNGVGRLGETDLDHLARHVPFVGALGDFQALVALQAQQRRIQHRGQGLGQLGLADTGLAFQKQRALQLEAQEHGGGQAPVAQVVTLGQGLHHGVDGAGRARVGWGHGCGVTFMVLKIAGRRNDAAPQHFLGFFLHKPRVNP
ncbi:hypothetical protein RA210_U50218 [Rubrivivax sp. A210]|nr:hypothetical protein RA210_U50218 [Rubrivivax sp. A210]